MAVTTRLKLLLYIFLCQLVSSASALAIVYPHDTLILHRDVLVNNSSGTIQVFNPSLGQLVTQGLATDGSGSNFSMPSVTWIAFSLLVGVPMALAGLRGWRFTTGVGIGLSIAVCVWSAFINTASSNGVSDLFLTIVVIASFWVGFILGLFEFGRIAGITCLGIIGGLAFGIRISLVKDELLISNPNLFVLNWLFITVLGVTCGLCLVWRQRAALVFACASVGTFLTALGADLVLNKQAGMSRGLRFLFDRNSSHLADILGNGYRPPMSSKIIIMASLPLTPILAYVQHRIFSQQFTRKPAPPADLSSLNLGHEVEEKRMTAVSMMWSDAKSKLTSRFSL